jgi:hypothetical protein
VRPLFAFVAVGLLAPTTADAGGLVDVGARIRLVGIGRPREVSHSPTVGGRVTGRVLATDTESLTVGLPDGTELTYRWVELGRLEASQGRRTRLVGALRVAGRGAVIGTACAVGIGIPAEATSEFGVGLSPYARRGALAGAGLGLVLGAIAPGERWSTVGRARVQIMPTTGPQGRGAGLAVSVGF